MTNYRVKLNVRLSEKETTTCCYVNHQLSFIVEGKNKLEAINKAISCLFVADSMVTEEEVSKKVGYDFKVKSYSLESIESVELIKE